MLLAARALGLGATLTTLYLQYDRIFPLWFSQLALVFSA
jgi:hypothetical protein